jgi:hypothetical protein
MATIAPINRRIAPIKSVRRRRSVVPVEDVVEKVRSSGIGDSMSYKREMGSWRLYYLQNQRSVLLGSTLGKIEETSFIFWGSAAFVFIIAFLGGFPPPAVCRGTALTISE